MGKLITLFSQVLEVTDEPVYVQRNYVKTLTTDIVILKDRNGGRYYVLRSVIDNLPTTIRRDSFNYRPEETQ
jgi:hypothetical protein